MPENHSVPAKRSRVLKWLAGTAGALVLLVVAAWLAVPPIVRSQLETRLTAATGRATTVEAVAFDPFHLKLTVRGLAIADRARPEPLLTVAEIAADISSASLWHRALVLDALSLTRPRVSLARTGDGRYNIEDLFDRPSDPEAAPPRGSLNNIEVRDGEVAFDDAVTGRKHLLAKLDIGIPFLSSLPYETDIRVAPRMNGTFNGSAFALGGTTTPFAQSHEAALDIDIEALPLPAYVVYLPVRPRFELAGGTLTTRLKVVFVDGEPGQRKLELRGDARVDGLALKRRDGSSLASAERIAVALDRIDLIRHDARIATIAAVAPVVDVRRLADGSLEWTRQFTDAPSRPSPAAPAAAPTAAPAGTPAAAWHYTIGNLRVERGAVTLVDETSTFSSALADVSLAVANLSSRPGEKAHVKVDFVSADRIAAFTGEADVEPQVPAANGHFALTKFSLGLLFPFYKSALAVDVQKGSLDYATDFAFDAAGNLRLTAGEAAITDLRLALPGNQEPLWRAPKLALHGIDVDAAARNVTIGEAQVDGAALRLVLLADGTLEMARVMRTSTTAGTTAGGNAATGAGATAGTGTADDKSLWTMLTKKLAFERTSIDFEDRGPQPPVKLAIRELTVKATDFGSASTGRANFTLRSRVGERGRLSFAGQFANAPLAVSGDLDASDLALLALRPYVEPRVNVVFTGGTLSAKGRLAVAAQAAAPARASWKGDVTIADFASLDKPTASDLARWKSLALSGVDLASEPLRIAVERIAVEDFKARLIVYSDASLNVVRLLTPDAAPEPAPDARPPAPDANAPPRTASPISIGRIEFARGDVNFTDLYIKPNYSVNLTDVAGSVSAMSAAQAGDVTITASVDHTAPVAVQGKINPFAPELSLDLTGKASDIDLPPLTPYSGKYAGYGIEKGKLTFDVHYKVDNRKLAAENRIVLDQLTFGAKVDSPTATKLPVLLAVALLKDRRGVIDIGCRSRAHSTTRSSRSAGSSSR
jgi:uncharacterized protein involved in outer membrane biogenesis